jgi:carbohydrate esterase-like sialic acid-specific acetylesterase
VAASGSWTGSLTSQPQGVGDVVCREVDATQNSFTIHPVGVGDRFVIAGQSNAVGQASVNYFYTSGTILGMSPFAAIFGGNYAHLQLVDPVGFQTGWVDAVNDNSGIGNFGGSIWPLVATSYITSTGLPIEMIPCAKDSSSISQWLPAADHQDRTTLYGACNYRVQQSGGVVKGWLWWQGESDAVAGTSSATYESNLKTIADAAFSDTGGVLVPTLLQTASGYSSSAQNTINTAINNAHANDSAHVAVPADFSNLYADDPFHLKSSYNITAAATGASFGSATVPMWTAIKNAFSFP